MPQPAGLAKLTMLFDLGNAGVVMDHAQFGIWGDGPFGEAASLDDTLQDIADFAKSQWITGVPKTLFSPAVTLNGALVGLYDSAGRLTHEKKSVALSTDWKGSATQTLPWAVTPCVSLYTYQRGQFTLDGRTKRGRIYLPPVGVPAMGNSTLGTMGQTTVDNLLSYIGDWLTAILGHTPVGEPNSFHPGVLSTAKGYFNELAYLSMDDKLDTQRRRERQQPATITTVPWP